MIPRRIIKPKKRQKTKKVAFKRPRIPTDKELYKLLSKCASKKYGSLCEICGKRLGTQAMHFFNKGRHTNVRFDLRNILWACTGCHIIDAHMNNDLEHARRILVKRLGIDGFEQLYIDAHKDKVKLTAIDRDRLRNKFVTFIEI